eukprot:TRINITY_DN25308_c0_g1_i1.p2 TRINITY_DN25308_c0_g1~~TRINITY_DN25308_c0_g1_i1.p2  ORF type:complete len:199 (+),score=18.30 TRINITY_DN25308_c0_g1_i1:58-597(+)
MVRYGRNPTQQQEARTAKARGSDLRVHFKNTINVMNVIKGMPLKKAQQYLKDVLAHKRVIPFKKYWYCVGRTAQAKEFGTNAGRWPEKSVKIVQALLQNAESNADLKALDAEKLKITHSQCNRAQKQRRRTYRAHGRVGAYMCSPCHIEVVLTQQDEEVKPPKMPWRQAMKVNRQQGRK